MERKRSMWIAAPKASYDKDKQTLLLTSYLNSHSSSSRSFVLPSRSSTHRRSPTSHVSEQPDGHPSSTSAGGQGERCGTYEKGWGLLKS